MRKIDIARLILKDKLAEADMDFKVEAYVIEQIGNIINAEDMFEIWDEMKINVTRIDRGTTILKCGLNLKMKKMPYYKQEQTKGLFQELLFQMI